MSLEEDILIEQFLRDELSEEDRIDFLNRVETDDEFKKSYLLEKQLFEGLNDKNWSYYTKKQTKEIEEYDTLFSDSKTQEIKENIEKASFQYQNRTNRNIFTLSSIAAVVVVIITFSIFFFNSSVTTEELYTEYIMKEKLPSLVNRGANVEENNLVEAESDFKSKKYERAIIYLDKALEEDKKNSLLYLYKAISHTELKEYNKAQEILNTLIDSDLVDGEKGYWFKSLVFLKSDRMDEAIKNLETIVQDSLYNQSKAKELLNKLNKK
ncbi:M48 family metallopeptidase [Aquimarina sp. Aq107]|uniref:tetratricopeptide repeat protein n=1 Tax=Aquimarina sp. Aq107 TaxID=1191912 RepID=UPI000D561BC5|nr:tetratricopeptide repeat protein [Aquimarina sp. Aq107]